MGGWITVGLKLLPLIVEAVNWVERFVTRKGKEKQDAAIQICVSMLGIAEAAIEKDIFEDSEVEAAARKTIDAVVALQNIIAKKRAASS
jgi:hypothetical protein